MTEREGEEASPRAKPASSDGFGFADPPAGLRRLAHSWRYARAVSK